jgi:hypothetical protein
LNAGLTIVQFFDVAAVAVVAGGQIYIIRSVLAAMRAVPEAFSVRMHQELLTRRPDSYLRPTTLFALLATIVSLVLLQFVDRVTLTTALTAVAFVALVLHAFISAHWEFPLNRRINAFTAESPPAEYTQMRGVWDTWHFARTTCTSLALLCLIGALMAAN